MNRGMHFNQFDYTVSLHAKITNIMKTLIGKVTKCRKLNFYNDKKVRSSSMKMTNCLQIVVSLSFDFKSSRYLYTQYMSVFEFLGYFTQTPELQT